MQMIEHENPLDKDHRARLHSRIRRTKQFLRPLPRRATLHRWPVIKWFAKAARQRPYLWKFGVREVSVAIYLGSLIAFLPILGFQFLIAFFVALAARTNLLTIMGVQMVTNLVTAPFVYGFTAYVGRHLMNFFGQPPAELGVIKVAYHLAIGGVIVGLLFGFVLDMIFRLTVARRLNRRVDVKRMLKS